MAGLEETGVSRVLVTDTRRAACSMTPAAGRTPVGQYAFYTEIVQALEGNDAFYCGYDGRGFFKPWRRRRWCTAARSSAWYTPISMTPSRAALLRELQKNLMTISIVAAVFAIGVSFLLSRMFTRRISRLLQAIRTVREGSYSHRAQISGSDEIAQIAGEFNSLTGRLQTTEEARRPFRVRCLP